MKVVITGGGGFLGRKLCLALLNHHALLDATGRPYVPSRIVCFDSVPFDPPLPGDPRVKGVVGDIGDAATVRALIDADVASVFHLAAVVSAGAEADFDLGMRVNLDGTRHVLDACRALPQPPKVVFTSSLAVYGGDIPPTVTDATPITPQTSYGAQKLIGEYLLTDYSRKGYLDGRALRLPTIVVRPGKPNKAASTFASSIIREPLQGDPAVCPVTPETSMPILSPRKAVAAFLHVHDLPAATLGAHRGILLNGIAARVGDMARAVERHGGPAAHARIEWKPDPAIQRIVSGWPAAIDAERARRLGFQVDADIDEIVANFIADDMRR
ncbi:MAG: NAD-dependent epimerase/dehydratase family protein [Alphaproteobacteria bacterium]|nr:NAD-dependent epimerase/dehydratase family protein [Alphaproteobacteria bacterium]